MSEVIEQQPVAIDLERFERLVYARRHEDALGELIKIINGIKQGAGFQWCGEAPSTEMLFTRLASAVTCIFADPTFAISYEGFVALSANHATFHSIFRLSEFRSTDYLLNLIGNRSPADQTRLEFKGGSEIPKLLMCWSLESIIDFSFEQLATTAPEFVSAALIGILGIGGIHTRRAYDRKIALLQKRDLIEGAPAHEAMVVPMCDVYMHCSYVDAPHKHEVKKSINKMLRNLVERKMAEHNVTFEERHRLVKKARPTIVVPLEWFGSHHAMYRCYAPSILQLRKHFRVVGIVRESDIDEVSETTFDKVVRVPPAKSSIFDLVQAVYAEEPDIMFYPSIGMAGWWVALSNFRLAPIQIMCPGHPATTHSPCIDYIVSDGDLFGDEKHYSEKCVGLPVGTTRYINGAKINRSLFKREPNPKVHIAVPAMAMKLVPPFFEALKRINMESTVPLEWHFFPNLIAAFHHLIKKDIQAWIPNAIVHHRKSYADYMDSLSQCDLMLSTFPFCGTNSIVDAFLVNMPVVVLEGDQIHEKSGASMIRRTNVLAGAIAGDVDQYVEKSLLYIQNRTFLEAAQQALKTTDIEAEFYGDGPKSVRGKFGAAFWNIYQQEIKKHGRKTGAVSGVAGKKRAGTGKRDAGKPSRPVGQPRRRVNNRGD